LRLDGQIGWKYDTYSYFASTTNRNRILHHVKGI
jgi:hypothetical protein